MRVMITGAYGFIGSQLIPALLAEGHELVGVGRNVARAARQWPQVQWISLDVARATRAKDWTPHLAGIEAVVNCVGVLQDSPGQSVRVVQVDAALALFAACSRAGIRRFIHLSAAGAGESRPTDFARTKAEADAALMSSDLDWIILRPSVVVGRAAYGGSALLRGLAALPGFVPRLPDAGPLQIVHVDDLVRTVVFFLGQDAPARKLLEIVGPERLSFTEVVLAYRRWFGLPEPRLVTVPKWLMGVVYRLGDLAGLLGWRPPVRSTAGREIVLGATGDPGPWMRETGIVPRSLEAGLAAEPASVQERWFAHLYLLKPLAIGVLSLFWIGTGIIAIGPGYGVGEDIMRRGDVVGPLATAAIVGGGLLDILVGVGIAVRRTARIALIASLAVSLTYFAIGTVLVPALWIDPLGPMLKIWPIVVFTLLVLAILPDR